MWPRIVFPSSSSSHHHGHCEATVLDVKLHAFGEQGGITGVALLAESHISIHAWPEFNYIALDVFVCGNCVAENAVRVFRAAFSPQHEKVTRHTRGQR